MNHLTSFILLVSFALAAGCNLELPPDRTSSPDKDRTGAREISLGATIIDDVDPTSGDSTDWKYVTIPGPGIITIKVSFDNPKAFGEMWVTDSRGQVLSVYNDKSRGILDNITFKGQSGQYFLRVAAEAQGTSYTIEVNYEAF